MTRTYDDDRASFDAHDDGLYLGVPEPTYHGLDAFNASRLSLVMRSPAHAEHAVRNPSPSTTAQRLGSAVHRACLQRESFDGHYEVTGHSSRTNAYKALVAEHGEDRVLSEADRETALRVAEAGPRASAGRGAAHERGVARGDGAVDARREIGDPGGGDG